VSSKGLGGDFESLGFIVEGGRIFTRGKRVNSSLERVDNDLVN